MQTRLFLNFSDSVFEWKWDGSNYTFKPKQQVYMEDFKAEHFAKHLSDRELIRIGKRVDDPMRSELIAKALPSDAIVENVVETEVDEPNEQESQKEPVAEEKVKKKFCDKCESKGRFHRVGCPNRPAKKEKDSTDNEFPDLEK